MAGWFNTQLPDSQTMINLIEKGNTLKALSNSMGDMMDIVDNRAKEKYTTTALEQLKGAKSMQDVMNLGLDTSKMTKAGYNQYSHNINMIDKVNQEARSNTLFDWKKEDRQFTIDNRAKNEATEGILSQLETMSPENKQLMFKNLDPRFVDTYKIRNADIKREREKVVQDQQDTIFNNQQTTFKQSQDDRTKKRLSINSFNEADVNKDGILDPNERTVFEKLAGPDNMFTSQTIKSNAIAFKAKQDEGRVKILDAESKYNTSLRALEVKHDEALKVSDYNTARAVKGSIDSLKSNFTNLKQGISSLYYLPQEAAAAIKEDSANTGTKVAANYATNVGDKTKINIFNDPKYDPTPQQIDDDGTMETQEQANARATKNKQIATDNASMVGLGREVNKMNSYSKTGEKADLETAGKILKNTILPYVTQSDRNMQLFFQGTNGSNSPFDSMTEATKAEALKNPLILEKYRDIVDSSVKQMIKNNRGQEAQEVIDDINKISRVLPNPKLEELSKSLNRIVNPDFNFSTYNKEYQLLSSEQKRYVGALGKKLGELTFDPSIVSIQDEETLMSKYIPEIARQYEIQTGQQFSMNKLAVFLEQNSRAQKLSDKTSLLDGDSPTGTIIDNTIGLIIPKQMPFTEKNLIWKNNASLDNMYKAIYQGAFIAAKKHAKFDDNGNPKNEEAVKLQKRYEEIKADPDRTWLKEWIDEQPGFFHKPTTAEKNAFKKNVTKGLFK